ncbi:hypothetical protein ABH926_008654 [Catenulispora sp. GP43]|uniref:hypothetical protein n=1 Tax=Catenulispora sp. GP43 TaxID=3156263 RepID=UPI0035181BA4
MAGVVLVGSLAACGGGGSSSSSSNQSYGTSSSDTSAEVTTSSPSPTTMSSAAYAQSLTAIGTELAPDFQAVANAHSTDDAKSALNKLSADAQTLSDGMPSDPPDALSASTTQLAQALRDFSTSAGTTASDLGSTVCTSAAALAEFTRSAGATSLRGVATSLNAVDPSYGKDLASFLPAPIADQNRQLGNGQVLRHSSGPGSLTINNSGTDAIVTLTKAGTKTPVASVYVRANANTTLSDIPGSTFDIYVSSGSDWDSAAQKFSRQCSYQKTDSTWDFSDSDWTLTLTRQVNGNLSVSTLNPGDAPNP